MKQAIYITIFLGLTLNTTAQLSAGMIALSGTKNLSTSIDLKLQRPFAAHGDAPIYVAATSFYFSHLHFFRAHR